MAGTHLAHKAEHAVDLETGASVGVTVQDADEGDTTTSRATLMAAAEQIETVRPGGHALIEVVADKGYHSSESLVDLESVGVRSYISEPDRASSIVGALQSNTLSRSWRDVCQWPDGAVERCSGD